MQIHGLRTCVIRGDPCVEGAKRPWIQGLPLLIHGCLLTSLILQLTRLDKRVFLVDLIEFSVTIALTNDNNLPKAILCTGFIYAEGLQTYVKVQGPKSKPMGPFNFNFKQFSVQSQQNTKHAHTPLINNNIVRKMSCPLVDCLRVLWKIAERAQKELWILYITTNHKVNTEKFWLINGANRFVS